MKGKNAERNAHILALRGKMSLAEIARTIGVSYAVVSKVCWAADHPRPRSTAAGIRALGIAAHQAGLTISAIRALARERGAA